MNFKNTKLARAEPVERREKPRVQLRLKRDDLTRRIVIVDRLAIKKPPLLPSLYSRWYAFLFLALYFPILHDLRERETTQVHLFWFWWRFTIIFPNGWFVHIFCWDLVDFGLGSCLLLLAIYWFFVKDLVLTICSSILLCKIVILISGFILIYALFSHCFLRVWFDLKWSGFSHFVSLFLASILLFIIFFVGRGGLGRQRAKQKKNL